MKKLAVTPSVAGILFLILLFLVPFFGSVLAWSEDDVNLVFKLAKHTPINDYPGGGSQNSTEGFGYRVEGWSVEPQAGFIRLALMNRTDCPGQVAKFRLEWYFGKDISSHAGWAKTEATWKDRLLFTVTTQVVEDGGNNTCIKANPEIRVEAGGAFYVAPTGPTYYNPKGHPDHIPGQRNVYIGAAYYAESQVKINIGSFPGLSQSALYTFQGFKEVRAGIPTITQIGEKCTYSGPKSIKAGEIKVNWIVDKSRKKYGLAIVALNKERAITDPKAWPSVQQLPWAHLVFFNTAAPGKQSTLSVNVEEGPIYITCFTREPAKLGQTLGPIDVQR